MTSTPAVSVSTHLSTPYAHHLSRLSIQPDFKALNAIVTKYIQLDLRQAISIDIDRFLIGLGVREDVLSGLTDSLADTIANSQAVQGLIEEYCRPVANEKDRYPRFCELVNHISLELGTQKVIFCRNDPNQISGSHDQTRSPDIIGIDSNDPHVANGVWRNHHGGPNKGVTWTWSDILSIFELKLTLSAISLDKRVLPQRVLGGSSGRSNASTRGENSNKHSAESGSRTTTIAAEEDEIEAEVPKLRGLTKQAAKLRSSMAVQKRKMQTDAESETSSQKRAKLDEGERHPRAEHAAQLARYAMDQMSDVHNRYYCIECLVVDGVLYMAYYDRVGIVHSTPLEFVHDRYKFVLLIKALSSMTRSEAGFLEELVAVNPKVVSMPSLTEDHNKLHSEHTDAATVTSLPQIEKDSTSGPSDLGEDTSFVHPVTLGQSQGDRNVEEQPPKEGEDPEIDCDGVPLFEGSRPQWRIKVGEDVLFLYHTADRRPIYGLITRGTMVYVTKCLTLDRNDPHAIYAVKFSWPLARRRSEPLILQDAKEVLERIDRSRDEEFNRRYGDRKLAECLPKLRAHTELVDLLGDNSFRKRAFDIEKHEQFREENRIWRALTYEFLVPLQLLPTLGYFKQAIRDVALGHHFLCVHNILHRDVSADNIMARIEDDYTMHGVLNDWDLAIVGKPAPEGHGGNRTGTRPFMAIELLSEMPPPHLERFDWESIFYVICRFGCRFSNPKEVCPTALSNWDEPDDSKLVLIKNAVLAGAGPETEMNFTKFYRPLMDVWISPLRRFFTAGMQARNTARFIPSFDMETLDGRVTWDKFWDILSRDTAPEQVSVEPPEGTPL